MSNDHEKFMQRAIEMASFGMHNNLGGPFGAVIVKDGEIIAEGHNEVVSSNDPTAHAEVVTIRKACEKLGDFQLDGCILYTSCEPCPMCLGAIYWARPDAVYFGCNKKDAADIGFDDHFIYEEIDLDFHQRKIKFHSCGRENALTVFQQWAEKEDRTEY
ncbi:nucleoside deaminase [Paracrocinitomix mangrovi]|uniref:nucleoside deaminase n=1 Tax=Paracrocinitomix mangrovi TaxID=2862509 RepID=UPI001C8D349E|nr:nucleoside deaminase [Paracrocinitomix mangrovi]UKN01292.1 nucleoside deaminase [Paracrocinitomix mangrovi]